MLVVTIKSVQKRPGRLRTLPKSREWKKERSIVNMLSMNLFLVIDMCGYWDMLACFFYIAKRPHDKNVQLFPDKEPLYFYKTTQIILALKAQLVSGSMRAHVD